MRPRVCGPINIIAGILRHWVPPFSKRTFPAARPAVNGPVPSQALGLDVIADGSTQDSPRSPAQCLQHQIRDAMPPGAPLFACAAPSAAFDPSGDDMFQVKPVNRQNHLDLIGFA